MSSEEEIFKKLFPEKIQVNRGVKNRNLNPGNIGNIHKNLIDIKPVFYEGLLLSCRKNLDINKVMFADWSMGTATPQGVRLGGALCRKVDSCLTESPIIVGDTNPKTLATNLQFKYYPWRNLKLETKIQTGMYPYVQDFGSLITSIELARDESTLTLNFYNPKKDAGRFTIGILNSLTKNLCFGAEILCEWTDKLLVQPPKVAFAGRYTMDNQALAATITSDAYDVSFWKRINKNVQVGSSVIGNKHMSKSVATMCYQLELDDTLIRASIDTDYSAGLTYHKRIKEWAASFGYSLLFNIPSNKINLGLKFELNSNL
jgi:mitochondrial import receptor subunit TOM40